MSVRKKRIGRFQSPMATLLFVLGASPLVNGTANASIVGAQPRPFVSVDPEALSNDIVVVGHAQKPTLITTAIASREVDLTLFLRDLRSDEGSGRVPDVTTDKQAAAMLKLQR